VLLVLRTEEAVKAFAAGKTLGFGGAASLALGPVGRSAEASLRVGGLAAKGAVLGYSCTKGMFAGVCMEGTVTSCRDAVNRAFYGCAVTPRQLLVDCCVPQPPAAALLYDRLDRLTALWENRGSLVQADAAAVAAVQATVSCKGSSAAASASCGVQQGKQQQQPLAAAAVREGGRGVGALSSSHESSSSREWDLVGAYAADAIEPFDDPPQQRQQQQQQGWQQQQQQQGWQQQQQGVVVEEVDDSFDDVEEFLASAPPAPTHLLHGYEPTAAMNNSSSSRQQQQQQVGAAAAEEEEEETMYALEW